MMLKMQQKNRLFIYDRKEMGVLLLLALLVAIFAFTLGVHLGKRVGGKAIETEQSPVPLAATVEDQTPSAQDLSDQARAAVQETDEALDKAAHDEVSRTGLKLDTPRQVELPQTTKAEKEAKAEKAEPSTVATPEFSLKDLAAAQRSAPEGKYNLQIGSHVSLEEAQDQIARTEAVGLTPFLRMADVPGKGKRYRIYVGGYPNRAAADQAGVELKQKGMIESFVVANAVK